MVRHRVVSYTQGCCNWRFHRVLFHLHLVVVMDHHLVVVYYHNQQVVVQFLGGQSQTRPIISFSRLLLYTHLTLGFLV